MYVKMILYHFLLRRVHLAHDTMILDGTIHSETYHVDVFMGVQ